MKRFVFALGFLILMITAKAEWTEAASITYIDIASDVTGSLGGVGFSGATITLTAVADTSMNYFSGGFLSTVRNSVLTAAVSGIADTFTFSGSGGTQTADNRSLQGSAGFGDFTTNSAILFTIGTHFTTYDLKTSIGPFSGPTDFNGGQGFATSGGEFIIASVGRSSFQAILAPAGVPEPSSLVLATITGVFGLGLAWLRR